MATNAEGKKEPAPLLDGILAPKPMKEPDNWEPMGEVEYRALFWTMCKFNQVNRFGIEWKCWGPTDAENEYIKQDTTPHYQLNLWVFLDIFRKVVGPTARKIERYREQNPQSWDQMVAKMEEIAWGGPVPPLEEGHWLSEAQFKPLTEGQFMEMMKLWKVDIGVPRDLHAAMADFVPGMCNIFRIRECAVMFEYQTKLAEFGGEPVGAGVPDVPADVTEEPRGELGTHALIFAGDGNHRLGMVKDVAELPRMKEKIKAANQILGYDVLDLCVNGPAEKLESPEFNGVAMYIAGWAAYEKFLHDNRQLARTAKACVGMDTGEYVALAVAGAISFEAGLELAQCRGWAIKELMECEGWRDQALCSVAGLSEARVRQLCDLAKSVAGGGDQDAGPFWGKDIVCQITNVLFDRGYTVGGHQAAVDAFRSIAEQDGALQVKVLEGQVAMHCPRMAPVQWVIKAKVLEIKPKIRYPWCDVYFNAQSCERFHLPGGTEPVKGELEMADIWLNITRYLCETCWGICRWNENVKSLKEAGVTEFYELSPNKQLKMLMKRIDKDCFDNTHNVEC